MYDSLVDVDVINNNHLFKGVLSILATISKLSTNLKDVPIHDMG